MEQAIRAEVLLAVNPQQVFAALTDEHQLTAWFSEYASVNLDQNRYSFWGRYTPDTPSQQSGDFKLLECVTGQHLAFTWHHHNADSRIDFAIESLSAGQTQLRVIQRRLGTVEPWLPEMFWSLALENLRGYLERGEPGVRYDFSKQATGDVRWQLDIAAAPNLVFDALINPEQLDRYMSEGYSVVDPQIGGRYNVGWDGDGPERILELDPPHKLAYSWRGKDDSVPEDTIVTWSLAESDGNTRLTLVHSGFAAEREGTDFTMGWLDFMVRIKGLAETGAAWQKVTVNIMDSDVAVFLPSAGMTVNVRKPCLERLATSRKGNGS